MRHKQQTSMSQDNNAKHVKTKKKTILDLQNEKFKLYPQKCFRIVGSGYGQKNEASDNATTFKSHQTGATVGEF